VGKKVEFGDTRLTIENLADFDFTKVQIGYFLHALMMRWLRR